MPRLMCALLLPFGLATLAAQPQGSQKTTIAGRVVNSATGQPISGALVRLVLPAEFRTAQSNSFRFVTEESGRFSFDTEVPRFLEVAISVSHTGFRSEDDLDAATVVIRPREEAKQIILRLVPQSVISGHVLTKNGDPIPGITVQAIRIEISDGRFTMRGAGLKMSDDRGEFRLWPLPPGRYYLRVLGNLSGTAEVVDSPLLADSQEVYDSVYYPTAINREEAQVLRAGPGDSIVADFRLGAQKTFKIRGRLINVPRGRSIGIRLLRGDNPVASRAAVNTSTGVFEVADVTPGTYLLQAFTQLSTPLGIGEAPVRVEGSDVTDVTVSMNPAVDVFGRFEFSEAFERLAGLNVTVRATPVNSLYPYPTSAVAKMDPDGTFTLQGLLPGKYDISVPPPLNFFLAGVSSGTADVLSEGLLVFPGVAPELTVRLQAGAAELTGVVEGATPGSLVNLVLVRNGGRSSITTRGSSLAEAVQVAGLTPGAYAVYAWPLGKEIEYRNPTVLTALAPYATIVSLVGGKTSRVNLKLIPPEAIP